MIKFQMLTESLGFFLNNPAKFIIYIEEKTIYMSHLHRLEQHNSELSITLDDIQGDYLEKSSYF